MCARKLEVTPWRPVLQVGTTLQMRVADIEILDKRERTCGTAKLR